MRDKYGVSQDIYCYPNSDVLRNLLDITDQAVLDEAELELTLLRNHHYVPGSFSDYSLRALQAIHRHLFQDLYSWAGEIRCVDISKGNTRFAANTRIEPEANKLFSQLQNENLLVGCSRKVFIERLAHYYSELNVIHPFREGNGRAQRMLFEMLAVNAGFTLHWGRIEPSEWLAANVSAFNCKISPLVSLFERVVDEIDCGPSA